LCFTLSQTQKVELKYFLFNNLNNFEYSSSN
jgi:hypothetical protein